MHLLHALLAAVLLYSGNTPSERFSAGILHVDHYANRGAAPVIFVPALYCGSWQWNAQIKALAPRYDLYIVTLPGFAGQPMIGGGHLMQRAVDSLHTLIAQRHLTGRVALVGHSLGGTITVMFAETYPRDIRAAISAEGGAPIAPTAAEREKAVATTVKPYIGLPQSHLGPVLRTNQLQYVITGRADVDAVERLASQSDPAAIVAWLRAAELLDLTPGLPRISVPFTEIVPYDTFLDGYRGYKNEGAKQAFYQTWIAHAPHGSIVMVAPAKHFVMFDQPRTFENTLERLLAVRS